jgi:uncharacterized beta-barrel protein YwiB (DUF1934 family)
MKSVINKMGEGEPHERGKWYQYKFKSYAEYKILKSASKDTPE